MVFRKVIDEVTRARFWPIVNEINGQNVRFSFNRMGIGTRNLSKTVYGSFELINLRRESDRIVLDLSVTRGRGRIASNCEG